MAGLGWWGGSGGVLWGGAMQRGADPLRVVYHWPSTTSEESQCGPLNDGLGGHKAQVRHTPPDRKTLYRHHSMNRVFTLLNC